VHVINLQGGRRNDRTRRNAARGPVTITRFVFDAGVAAKWILPTFGEPLAVGALRLLAGYADCRLQFASGLPMIVPGG